jgi:hypothetical protein
MVRIPSTHWLFHIHGSEVICVEHIRSVRQGDVDLFFKEDHE